MSKPGFNEITHTADLAIEIWGESLCELFGNALSGMNFLIFRDAVSGKSAKNGFCIKEYTWEDLLASFLNECNFRIQSRGEYIRKIYKLEIEQINDYYELNFEGEFLFLSKKIRRELTEIKSVTYHQMMIVYKNSLYKTKIIFDI